MLEFCVKTPDYVFRKEINFQASFTDSISNSRRHIKAFHHDATLSQHTQTCAFLFWITAMQTFKESLTCSSNLSVTYVSFGGNLCLTNFALTCVLMQLLIQSEPDTSKNVIVDFCFISLSQITKTVRTTQPTCLL